MPSEKYRKLRQRIKQLRKNFIPKFSETGDYTEKQRDMAAGFRLLVHAEVEEFLEESAKEIALNAIKACQGTGKPGYVLACLLSHFPKRKISQNVIEDEKSGRSSRLQFALRTAHAGYVYTLDNNHGIREENLRKILFPIGVKHVEMNATWLNTIDSFGADRGAVAHRSAAAGQAIDPETEVKTVKQIMEGLEKLDHVFLKLR
jgi:RiboL-PSP-HEPN